MAGLTLDNPVRLSAALISEHILPGDTLKLRGGIYRGQYISTISGTPEAPVIIEPLDQTPVIIEGGLTIQGADTHWRGLEVRGDWRTYPRSISQIVNHVAIFGARTKLVNCLIHDVAQIGWWTPAVDSELYGCLLVNIGVTGIQSSKWHPIYTQNATGLKRVTDCIILPGFSEYGIHVYASGGAIKGYRFEGVVHIGTRWQIGGASPFSDILLRKCATFGGSTSIGYLPTIRNADVTLEDNDFAAHLALLAVGDWTMTNNRFRSLAANGAGILSTNWYDAHEESINRNTYITPAASGSLFSVQGSGRSFRQWQALGYDAGGRWTVGTGEDRFIVQPNAYEAGRAHIIVYNWSQASSVSIDVSGLSLVNGGNYRLRNAYDPLSDYENFTYDGSGSITVNFTGRTVALPTGYVTPLATLDPRFGAWILEEA